MEIDPEKGNSPATWWMLNSQPACWVDPWSGKATPLEATWMPTITWHPDTGENPADSSQAGHADKLTPP